MRAVNSDAAGFFREGETVGCGGKGGETCLSPIPSLAFIAISSSEHVVAPLARILSSASPPFNGSRGSFAAASKAGSPALNNLWSLLCTSLNAKQSRAGRVPSASILVARLLASASMPHRAYTRASSDMNPEQGRDRALHTGLHAHAPRDRHGCGCLYCRARAAGLVPIESGGWAAGAHPLARRRLVTDTLLDRPWRLVGANAECDMRLDHTILFILQPELHISCLCSLPQCDLRHDALVS